MKKKVELLEQINSLLKDIDSYLYSSEDLCEGDVNLLSRSLEEIIYQSYTLTEK